MMNILDNSNGLRVVFCVLINAIVLIVNVLLADGNQDLSESSNQRNQITSKSTNYVTINRKLIPVNCKRPLMGQYLCRLPTIDSDTQQPINCGKDNKAKVICDLYEGFVCDGTVNVTSFTRDIDCLYTNGYYFETTLLLSIFLGMFGADRFYLGYPGIGLLKLCTFGCFFILQFIDIILIALQVLKPVDNSNYIIKYYGPRLKILYADNETYPL